MPHADGRQRPIGTPTLADTIVQRATGAGRKAIDEQEVLGGSDGARPGRRPPPAVDAGTGGRAKRPITWGLEAAMRGVYDALDHAWLGQCVEHRRGAQRVVRPIRQWLKAGVLEEGHWRQQEEGTPQGGSARPLLAHRSRHDVCERWAAQWRRRHARGDVMIVRYGDDGMVGFQHKDDAEQCVSALRERCHRFHRARHPDKTRRSAWGRWASERRQRRGPGHPETFAVLGWTHICGTTTRGKCTVRRCPIATRRRKKRQEVKQTLRERMHWPIEKRGAWRKRVVLGHYRYSGVPRNMGRLWGVRERILRSWCRT
jgi:RNA-directed DNA polymerase